MQRVFLLGAISRLAALPLRRAAAPFCLASLPKQLLVPLPHPATLDGDDLRKDCDVTQTKGSGPGGQRKNKVATAIILTHRPTETSAKATESRSQATNLKVATFRLRTRLALECRSESVAAEPSARWSSRAQGGKLSVNAAHADFPSILSEALDHVFEARDVKAASEALNISTSQMVKLLSKEPAALRLVNELREADGLGALRPT